MLILGSANRLQAAKADVKAAETFLTELGFSGLRFKSSKDDIIQFAYKAYDKAQVTKHLGAPKAASTGIRYRFGNQGVVAIFPNRVVLKNSKRTKPAKPEPKTGTMNDDDKVPLVHITEALHKEYQRAQTNPSARLKFCTDLWKYFNTTKFGSKLGMPNIRLLKNVAGTSFRTRGYWNPSNRKLAVSPRLFNASQEFFVETFLHEMCHQAVSEIDRKIEYENQSHGPLWASWMRKVGLNPLRFDPVGNATYMTDKERDHYNKTRDQYKDALYELIRLGLKQTTPAEHKAVTFVNDGQLIDGVCVCPAPGKKWAVLPVDTINSYTQGSLKWFKIGTGHLYQARPTSIYFTKYDRLANLIKNFYEQKENERFLRREKKHRQEWGY